MSFSNMLLDISLSFLFPLPFLLAFALNFHQSIESMTKILRVRHLSLKILPAFGLDSQILLSAPISRFHSVPIHILGYFSYFVFSVECCQVVCRMSVCIIIFGLLFQHFGEFAHYIYTISARGTGFGTKFPPCSIT
jgi:hypothetical protein